MQVTGAPKRRSRTPAPAADPPAAATPTGLARASPRRLRDFGNRGGRLVADLVGVDDRHPRHQDRHGLAVLALLGPGDTPTGVVMIVAPTSPCGANGKVPRSCVKSKTSVIENGWPGAKPVSVTVSTLGTS